MFKNTTLASFALSGCALLVLSACGGGSDSSAPPAPPAPPPPPVTVTLTGQVMVDQAAQNVLVCMDLNANGACDTGEPSSARTGPDGAYSLSYKAADVSAAQVAESSLIARIEPGSITDASTSIDAAYPGSPLTTTAYVLRQVPGKSGQINPLTTLVAAGLAQGMAEATARANVAVQLAISDAKIDSYQDNPASDATSVRDNARSMALLTAAALQAGAVLEVGDQQAAVAAASGDLATLRYFDASNYFVRTLDFQEKAAGSAGASVKDNRSGLTSGVATASTDFYTQAYLGSSGWTFCSGALPLPLTRGNPSRSQYCNALDTAGFRVREDVSGQGMSTVVTGMQTDTAANSINNGNPTASLLTKLGTASFPADAVLQKRVNLNVSRPLYINTLSSDILNPAITSLEQVMSAFPSSGVNLTAGRGTLGLGVTTTEVKVLRVAFTGTTSPTAGTVQYYECDLNVAQNTIANCVTTQTGTYAIETVQGMRVLRYTGFSETIMNNTRVHVEVPSIAGLAPGGTRVYVARESKPDLANAVTRSNRLNSTAWAAMRATLGIQ